MEEIGIVLEKVNFLINSFMYLIFHCFIISRIEILEMRIYTFQPNENFCLTNILNYWFLENTWNLNILLCLLQDDVIDKTQLVTRTLNTQPIDELDENDLYKEYKVTSSQSFSYRFLVVDYFFSFLLRRNYSVSLNFWKYKKNTLKTSNVIWKKNTYMLKKKLNESRVYHLL